MNVLSPGPNLISTVVLLAYSASLTACAFHAKEREEALSALQERKVDKTLVQRERERADKSHASNTADLQSLDQLMELALQENPDIQAARDAAFAGAESISIAGSLPNPELEAKVLPEPVRTAEGDNYFVLGVSQRLPYPEKLSRRANAAERAAYAAREVLDGTIFRVLADVKRRYFQLYVVDRTTQVTAENQKLLHGLLDVARAQVATSNRSQDDVLRAQVELANLEAQLIALRQERESLQAALNALVNRHPADSIASAELEIRPTKFSLTQLLAGAEKENPELRRLKAELGKSEEEIRLAELQSRPDFKLGLQWMPIEPRTGTMPGALSEDGSDNWALVFGASLPIWFEKNASEVERARHTKRSTEQSYHAAQKRIESMITDAFQRVEAQRELALLFKHTIIPQAEQTYSVSLAAYAGSRADFLDVVENWQKWLVFTIQYYRSVGAYETAVADLEELLGSSIYEAAKSNEH